VCEVCRTTLLENGKEKTANPQKLSSFFLVFDMFFLFEKEGCRGFSQTVLQEGFDAYFVYVIR